jgi:hypothetical protein
MANSALFASSSNFSGMVRPTSRLRQQNDGIQHPLFLQEVPQAVEVGLIVAVNDEYGVTSDNLGSPGLGGIH